MVSAFKNGSYLDTFQGSEQFSLCFSIILNHGKQNATSTNQKFETLKFSIFDPLVLPYLFFHREPLILRFFLTFQPLHDDTRKTKAEFVFLTWKNPYI